MPGFLNGQLLIAMPQMDDKRFQNTVLLICSHDSTQAMGVVLNQRHNDLELSELAQQVGIGEPRFNANEPIHIGGPVEPSRGIVVHSSEHVLPDTTPINHDMAMTANIKVLSEIINGVGPNDFIIALGHASWTAGQLEKELRDNIWLTMPYESDLIFDHSPEEIWGACFTRLGISAGHLSTTAGHA
ncbi:MAG: YqgE/AlgH family protein [Alphaproteobacteria bacterium]|nr:YqgE/AlgH family protein [Alphaproteobacteria bacterium]